MQHITRYVIITRKIVTVDLLNETVMKQMSSSFRKFH